MENRNSKTILYVISFLTLFVTNSFAQSNPVKEFTVVAEIVSENSSYSETNPVVASTDVVRITAIVDLNDTTNISAVKLVFGVSPGADTLVNKEFTYTSPGDYNDGTSYHREGNVLYIKLGEFAGINHFYARASLRREDNSYSSVNEFSR